MRARRSMTARVGASRGDGGGTVDERTIRRLGLGDHRDWSGIASLHGRAECIPRSRCLLQRLEKKGCQIQKPMETGCPRWKECFDSSICAYWSLAGTSEGVSWTLVIRRETSPHAAPSLSALSIECQESPNLAYNKSDSPQQNRHRFLI